MQIQEHVSLKPYNTFGIDVSSRYFMNIKNIEEAKEALDWCNKNNTEDLILGGGSNVLLTKNFDGAVLKNELRGISILKEDENHVLVKVAAGEVWHQFVLYALDHNFAGIENLALIPGCAGASPMQNIGAYGIEIKSVFHELTAINKQTLSVVTFKNADCEFGYRESVFKNKYKGEFLITAVTYRLNKNPVYHIEYGAIRQELEKENISTLSIRAIANAVIKIRTSKLPDPNLIGNAGSFFKNPSVAQSQFKLLKAKFPDLVAYPNADGTQKLAAGWMIEQCGLKGYRHRNAGVHNKQALVLVNYSSASGSDVLEVCQTVKKAVFDRFGVLLSAEVNIV